MQFDTQDLWQRDKTHFLHPWQHFDSFKRDGSLVIARGDGAYIFDADGNKYLDGIGGMWCVNVGYGRKEISQVMAEQAETLAYYSTFYDTTNPPAVELATKLAALAPGSLNHVMFACSGSGANDSAIRLAHYYQSRRGKPEKKHILAREGGYHGSTYLAASLSSRWGVENPHFQYTENIIHLLSEPNTYRRPDGLTEAQFADSLVDEFDAKLRELGAQNIAAFIAEPIQGSGGVIMPPAGYLKRIAERCCEEDILYISDEVVTAFGRLGHMFASRDAFDIQPDMIVMAKGLTSGYIPMGATLFTDEIYDAISAPDPEACFEHGFTYSGHPVACAVALKNIEIIERENICDHVLDVGAYFEERLKSLSDLPLVGDVRGQKFMLCLEYVANKQTKALLPDELDIGKRIADACGARGLMVRPMEYLNVLSPPLILSKGQIDFIVDTLSESVLAVDKEIAALV